MKTLMWMVGSLFVVCANVAVVHAQGTGPIVVRINGIDSFRYNSGQNITLTNVNNTINLINIFDSAGGSNSIGSVSLDGGTRNAPLQIFIGAGSFPTNPTVSLTPAAFNFGGLTLGNNIRSWSQLAGAINGNFTGFVSVGAIYRLQSDVGDIVAPINAEYSRPGVGFSGNRAIANIRVRTIAAPIDADAGIIDTVTAAAVQQSIIASTGSILSIQATGAAGINMLPGTQISARNGVGRIAATAINATIIANSGNLLGGNIDSIQTTAGGFSGSLQATNLTNNSPSTSGIRLAGPLSANITLEGSVASRIEAPSASGAILIKQGASGPITASSGGFTNLRINGPLTSILTVSSTSAADTIRVAELAPAGRVVINGSHAGSLIFGTNTPSVVNGLGAQVVINASNLANTWTGSVQYAGATPLFPTTTYAQTPSQFGGGAVGLVPFRIHRTAGTPGSTGVNGDIAERLNNRGDTTPSLPSVVFYGPVKADNAQSAILEVLRADPQSPSPVYSAVNPGEFTVSVAGAGGIGRTVSVQAGYPARPLPGRYRVLPTANLICDLVPGSVPASRDIAFEFTIVDGCSPADISDTDGTAAPVGIPDGQVDNGDFNAFFAAFFLPSGDPGRLQADIANTDGNVANGWTTGAAGGGPDGQIDNGDFTAFFDAFFVGCSSSALGGGESMLAALSATAGGQGINLSALTSAELSARLEQLRALGRPIILQDLQAIMPEIFVGGAGGGGAGDQ